MKSEGKRKIKDVTEIFGWIHWINSDNNKEILGVNLQLWDVPKSRYLRGTCLKVKWEVSYPSLGLNRGQGWKYSRGVIDIWLQPWN